MTRRLLRIGTHQRGLSLATAIFVITAMALLAVMIFQMVRNNAETTGEEIELIRAFYAAETGVQFGVNAVFPPDPLVMSSCPVTATVFDLAEDGLNGCTASVLCSSVVVSGASYYTIQSTGKCGDVSRTVQVRAQ